jgi:hypothetical protein
MHTGPHGGGRGGCHLTKLARWTRGWGVLEVIEFCEAAGLTMCTVGLADSETVQVRLAMQTHTVLQK